jgi:hypothetical protein
MIQKKFSKTYDEALTQAYLFHSEFVLDLALFTAFSPSFDADFASDFLDLIEAADTIPTNQEDLNNQVILSTAVEEQMVVARSIYQELLVYIGLAVPNSETALLAFGNNMYEKARYSPQKLVNLLQLAHRNANSTVYKAALIAAGFLQTDIDSLETIATELNTRYNVQQDYLQHTYSRTEERTIAFNAVWDVMVKINAASKIVFKDSPAKIEFYLLYQASTPIGTLTAPTNFEFNNGTLIFDWHAVENATSYELESSTDGTNYSSYWTGTELSCTLTEIPSTMMYYRVRARNAGGYGPSSDVIQYDFHPPLVAPSNIVLIPHLSQFMWGNVISATSYEFQFKHTDQENFTSINVGLVTSYIHLDPAGDYVCRVRAVRNLEYGPFSNELYYTVAEPG